MTVALWVLYGLFAFVALTNRLLMRRVGAVAPDPAAFAVLIPARNEAANLEELVPSLTGQGIRTYVYDDGSEDATAEVAARHGATVLRGAGHPPEGWTGKNHACHRLAQAAAEDFPGDWIVFLDADVRVSPDFGPALGSFLRRVGPRTPMVTGFGTMRSGHGIEPLFLGWVGWILLASNPFGIVARTGMGHNRFTNGQFGAWRTDLYAKLWPHEAVRDRILEDVLIGRLLARERVRVEVADLTRILTVRMYETWRQAFDGMSKNSYEIAGSSAGTLALAAFLLFAGWGWTLMGAAALWGLALFTFSGLLVAWTARTVVWPVLFMPILATIGAVTMVRSAVWHRRGAVHWKGRTYPGKR